MLDSSLSMHIKTNLLCTVNGMYISGVTLLVALLPTFNFALGLDGVILLLLQQSIPILFSQLLWYETFNNAC